MHTGWRPADVAQKFPLYKIDNVYSFSKYNKGNRPIIIIWSWIQFVVVTISCLHLFSNIAQIGSPGMFWYGGFIFLQVYAFTDLMDENKWAFIPELLKVVFVVGVLLINKNWLAVENLFVSYAILGYSVISVFMVVWILGYLKREKLL